MTNCQTHTNHISHYTNTQKEKSKKNRKTNGFAVVLYFSIHFPFQFRYCTTRRFFCRLLPLCLMFRPLYWNFVGVNRQHRRYAFHAVITPHTQQQTQRRAHLTVDELLRRYHIRLPELWFQVTENTCHWVNVGSSFLLYVKKKYNRTRRRWELELISLTPSQYTHTANHQFARPIATHRHYTR